MGSPSSRRALVQIRRKFCAIEFAIIAFLWRFSIIPVGSVDIRFYRRDNCAGLAHGCTDKEPFQCCLSGSAPFGTSARVRIVAGDRLLRTNFWVNAQGCTGIARAEQGGSQSLGWQPCRLRPSGQGNRYSGAKWYTEGQEYQPHPRPVTGKYPSPPTVLKVQNPQHAFNSDDKENPISAKGYGNGEAHAQLPITRHLLSDTASCAGPTEPNAAFFTETGMKGHWVLPISNWTEYWSQVKDISDEEIVDWFRSEGATYTES
ncbi:unnamed protein product [Calypogeia fissa]